jgi:hypothetical protein
MPRSHYDMTIVHQARPPTLFWISIYSRPNQSDCTLLLSCIPLLSQEELSYVTSLILDTTPHYQHAQQPCALVKHFTGQRQTVVQALSWSVPTYRYCWAYLPLHNYPRHIHLGYTFVSARHDRNNSLWIIFCLPSFLLPSVTRTPVMIKGTCYSIRGTRTERPRRVVLQGPLMGVPYGVYLEHPLCVYCNVVPAVLHPLLHSLPYPYLLVPCDTIPGLQASLIAPADVDSPWEEELPSGVNTSAHCIELLSHSQFNFALQQTLCA